jgi:heat-inducible transcriptional repressor
LQERVLTDRAKKLLYGLVQSYIRSATPVGSRQLVKEYRLNWSSATVRNEISNLENMGYVSQPYTSAGRVPTDKGYRYYVNNLKKYESLDPQEYETIDKKINAAGRITSRILEETSKILGEISNELAVVLTPTIYYGIFDRLELIELTQKKVLVVIRVRSHQVKTVILKIDSHLKSRDLEITAEVLNQRLSGLTLNEIQKSIKERLRNASYGHLNLIRYIMDSSTELFDFSEPISIHKFGTPNIVVQPEFSDRERLENIFNIIDDSNSLIKLFRRDMGDTKIVIGRENEDERLHELTVISTNYTRGKDIGTMGIIGPMRMPYSRILSLMSHVSHKMSEQFG